MSGSRTFELKITGDVSGVQNALGRAGRAAEDTSRKVGALGSAGRAAEAAMGGLAGRLGGVGTALSSLGPAGVAAAAAIGGLGLAMASTVRSAEQFERLGLRTEAIVRATGSAAGLTAQQIREMARAIARETLASTEGVEQAAQKLLTFRSVASGAFERTLRVAQDLAATGFGSLESATVQLGKALEDPERGLAALARSGVTFTEAQRGVIASMMETGRQAEAHRLILEAVERQVGGAGRAEAGGLAGAYDSLKQNIQEVFTQLGNLGPLRAATGAVNLLADAVGRVNRGLEAMAASRTPDAVAERAVEAAQRRLEQVRAAAGAQNRAGAYGPSRQELEGQAEALRIAEANLAGAQQRLQEIRQAGEAEAARLAAEGAATRAEIERDAAQAAVDALRAARDQSLAIERTYQQAVATVNRAVAAGVLTRAEAERELAAAGEVRRRALANLTREETRAATREITQRDRVRDAVARDADAARRELEALGEGVAAREALAVQLEVENRLREAGIPAVERRTAAEIAAAEAIERNVRAHAALRGEITRRDNATREAQREAERALQEIGRTAERISDDVAQALFDGMTGRGREQSVLDFFKTLFRRIAIQALSANIILPISTAIVGGAPGLFGIGGAGGGGGANVLGLAGSLNGLTGGGLGNALGLGGLFGGGGLSGLMNTTIIGASGPIGPTLSGAALGGGASLGQLLGGVGAGFAAGSVLNSLLGGKQMGGTIGSGAGSVAGAIIGSIIPGVGTLLGGILGGAAGGALGGLFGNAPSNKEGNARFDFATGQLVVGGQTGGKFSQQNRDAASQTAQQVADLVRGIAEAVGGRIGGGSFQVGVGDRAGLFARVNGQEIGRYGRDEAGMQRLVGDLVRALAPNIQGGAAAQEFRSALSLGKATTPEDIAALAALVKAISDVANPMSQFEQAMKGLRDQFDPLIETARRLGYGEAQLTAERERALQALTAQREATLEGLRQSLTIRGLRATGREDQATLLQFDLAAAAELAALAEQLTQLGVAAARSAELIADLEAVQRQERRALLSGAQGTLAALGGSIQQFLDRLRTTPAGGRSAADQLAAARGAFDTTLAAARLNDPDALRRITGDADALLSAARSMFASGAQFTALRDFIEDSLGSLDAVARARAGGGGAPLADAGTVAAAWATENEALRAEMAAMRQVLEQIAATNARMAYSTPPTPVGART
jgi:hypothetical protein